jgi:hypothetical protein
VLLCAAAWLDQHRDWAVTGITFRYPAVPGHDDYFYLWDEGFGSAFLNGLRLSTPTQTSTSTPTSAEHASASRVKT